MALTRNRRQHHPGLALAAALGVAAWLAGSWQPASADVVYKWSDPQGNIHYSDRPPTGDGKLISVEQSNYPQHHANAPEAPRPAPAAAAAAAPNPQTKQAVAADVAAAQVDNCKKAQERYQNYIHWRHMYREGPNQERIYLSAEELETERLNAKREADEACAEANP